MEPSKDEINILSNSIIKSNESIKSSILINHKKRIKTNTLKKEKKSNNPTKVKDPKQLKNNKHNNKRIPNEKESLTKFGFTYNKENTPQNNNKVTSLDYSHQCYLPITPIHIPNEPMGDPMATKSNNSIHIYYMKINGIYQTFDEHSLIQLYSSLKNRYVDTIF